MALNLARILVFLFFSIVRITIGQDIDYNPVLGVFFECDSIVVFNLKIKNNSDSNPIIIRNIKNVAVSNKDGFFIKNYLYDSSFYRVIDCIWAKDPVTREPFDESKMQGGEQLKNSGIYATAFVNCYIEDLRKNNPIFSLFGNEHIRAVLDSNLYSWILSDMSDYYISRSFIIEPQAYEEISVGLFKYSDLETEMRLIFDHYFRSEELLFEVDTFFVNGIKTPIYIPIIQKDKCLGLPLIEIKDTINVSLDIINLF